MWGQLDQTYLKKFIVASISTGLIRVSPWTSITISLVLSFNFFVASAILLSSVLVNRFSLNKFGIIFFCKHLLSYRNGTHKNFIFHF